MAKAKTRPGMHLIFVAYITLKNGKRLYASAYGKRAWAIWVKD
jgi:hypothetical protein